MKMDSYIQFQDRRGDISDVSSKIDEGKHVSFLSIKLCIYTELVQMWEERAVGDATETPGQSFKLLTVSPAYLARGKLMNSILVS